MMSLRREIKNMTQINLSVKQTHRHEEPTCGCEEEGGEGWTKPGFERSRCKTIIFMMNKPQGPIV